LKFELKGEDLRSLPLLARKATLANWCSRSGIVFKDLTDNHGTAVFQHEWGDAVQSSSVARSGQPVGKRR
jgi:hypothetical protein